jgi:hypothetical protein
VFANAAFFTERLEELVANAGAELKCVTLDLELSPAETVDRFRKSTCTTRSYVTLIWLKTGP